MNSIKTFTARLGMVLTCLILVSQAAFAEVAGHVQFANGIVKAVDASGVTSTLKKGAAVREGDTLQTVKGASAQIKMQDGGLVAIRPETTLRFDSFKYKGQEDGSENLLFTLVKGGFRSVTGAIGRINKPNYKIQTAVATIGIRGTDHETFVVTPDDPLSNVAPAGTYNKVNVGETFMTTDRGTIFILPNQMGFAGAANQEPQLQPINPDIFTVAAKPTSQGKSDKGDMPIRDSTAVDQDAQAQTVSENITPAIPGTFILPVCTTNPATGQCVDLTTPPALQTTGGNGVKFAASTGLHGMASPYPFPLGANYTLNDTGLIRMDCGAFCFGGIGTAQLVDIGWDSGVVHWGRWSNGAITAGGTANGLYFGPNQGLHFIVGIPTPLTQIPTNITYTYNLIGGTSPTPSDGVGGGLGLGHLISGSATVNFTNATINGNLLMGFNGSSIYQSNYRGSFVEGIFVTGNTTFQSGSINVCGTAGCSTQYQGQFYGTNASHLGVAFMINTNQSFDVNGAAVMQR